jgi:hypothetical protein
MQYAYNWKYSISLNIKSSSKILCLQKRKLTRPENQSRPVETVLFILPDNRIGCKRTLQSLLCDSIQNSYINKVEQKG